jgi:hypothetical protein
MLLRIADGNRVGYAILSRGLEITRDALVLERVIHNGQVEQL